MLSYVFLIAGVAVRELGNDKTFNMPRRLYAFSLVLMYLRCLKVFVIHKTIGTTLSIIKEMVFITNVCETDKYALFIKLKKENTKNNFERVAFMLSIFFMFLFCFSFVR